MLKTIESNDPTITAFDAVGHLTHDDYKDVLIPALEGAIKTHGKAKALLRFGEGFEGYTVHAMLDDTVFGLSHLNGFERIAVVTDVSWIRQGVALFAHLTPLKVRLFPANGTNEALRWLAEDEEQDNPRSER
ncbi:MAG: STAS/SEC14 domain-containing protein [Parvularcula sp.]